MNKPLLILVTAALLTGCTYNYREIGAWESDYSNNPVYVLESVTWQTASTYFTTECGVELTVQRVYVGSDSYGGSLYRDELVPQYQCHNRYMDIPMSGTGWGVKFAEIPPGTRDGGHRSMFTLVFSGGKEGIAITTNDPQDLGGLPIGSKCRVSEKKVFTSCKRK